MTIVDPFDLTPISVRHQRSATAAISRYIVFTIVLSGLLSSLIITRWQQRERQRLSLHNLMSEALPIRDKRLESLRLQQSNQQLKAIVEAVESAEPRDSLLQTLAAVTEGVVDFGLEPRQLHIRLAVEPPAHVPTPAWANASMKMTVETSDDSLAIRAHESIANEERFENVKTLGLSRLGDVTRTDLVAVPRAEVLLP